MALQAYIDDSRGDGSGIFVLAGYIATAEQWIKFSEEWREILPLACQDKNGRYRFKTSEMMTRKRDIQPFYSVIERHVLASISCIIDIKALNRCVSSLSANVKGDNGVSLPFDLLPLLKLWSDPNFFAFRALMDNIHSNRFANPEGMGLPDEPLDMIFDEWGRKNVIRHTWDDYVSTRPSDVRHLYRSEPRFESDDEFLPLQAADFRAWWVRHWIETHGFEHEKWTFPYKSRNGKGRHLFMHMKEEDIMSNLAKALVSSIQQYFNKGGKLHFDKHTGSLTI